MACQHMSSQNNYLKIVKQINKCAGVTDIITEKQQTTH